MEYNIFVLSIHVQMVKWGRGGGGGEQRIRIWKVQYIVEERRNMLHRTSLNPILAHGFANYRVQCIF